MPPHQYLLLLRIQHAKELLLNTRYSIAKIAEYCGFSDIHHFFRAFRQHEDLTPLTFRNRNRSFAKPEPSELP